MSASLRIALLGFTDFERRTLESYFRLAFDAALAFDLRATPEDCDAALIDADLPSAVAAARRTGCLDRGVCIGHERPEQGARHLRRPIDPLSVLRALEGLLRRSSPALPDTVHGTLDAVTPQRPRLDLDGCVLVAESHDLARRFLQVRFERLGCEVLSASDGAQALTLLRGRHVAWALVDLNIDGGQGFALCDRLRDAAASPGMAIVSVSSHAGESERVRAILYGCDDHLAKPIRTESLLDLAERLRQRVARQL